MSCVEAQIRRFMPRLLEPEGGTPGRGQARPAGGCGGGAGPRSTPAPLVSATVAELLSIERDGEVALVTLERPEKRNALSIELQVEALARLSAASATTPASGASS